MKEKYKRINTLLQVYKIYLFIKNLKESVNTEISKKVNSTKQNLGVEVNNFLDKIKSNSNNANNTAEKKNRK
jgi:hypothetical protein